MARTMMKYLIGEKKGNKRETKKHKKRGLALNCAHTEAAIVASLQLIFKLNNIFIFFCIICV